MIPGDLLSAFHHRQFHTLTGLLGSWAALPNSYPNALRAMHGGSLYHFLWWSLVWPGREANSRPTVREADTLPTRCSFGTLLQAEPYAIWYDHEMWKAMESSNKQIIKKHKTKQQNNHDNMWFICMKTRACGVAFQYSRCIMTRDLKQRKVPNTHLNRSVYSSWDFYESARSLLVNNW